MPTPEDTYRSAYTVSGMHTQQSSSSLPPDAERRVREWRRMASQEVARLAEKSKVHASIAAEHTHVCCCWDVRDCCCCNRQRSTWKNVRALGRWCFTIIAAILLTILIFALLIVTQQISQTTLKHTFGGTVKVAVAEDQLIMNYDVHMAGKKTTVKQTLKL
jgi:hypothetical protein